MEAERIQEVLDECTVILQGGSSESILESGETAIAFGSRLPAATGIPSTQKQSSAGSDGKVSEKSTLVMAEALMDLTGSPEPFTEEQVSRAADLLVDIVTSPFPAMKVSEHLQDIDALLPALLELNVRQAEMDGNSALAEALRALQTNIRLQLDIQPLTRKGKEGQAKDGEDESSWVHNVLLLAPDFEEASVRARVIQDSLTSQGIVVDVLSDSAVKQPGRYDAVIACNPHVSPQLLEAMATCSASHVPIVLDLEYLFEGMPASHPLFGILGLSSMEKARAYTNAILLANMISVPQVNLSKEFYTSGKQVVVVPDGWTRKNTLWEKPGQWRRTLNLGWFTQYSQIDDLLLIRRVLMRTIREFPQTQMVVCGDPQAYQLFDNLPDNRKLFIPCTESEDFPYLLNQVDVLLLPMRNSPYNNCLSDRALVEAGVKGIPWIASTIPAYQEWKEGGMLVSSVEEWHSYLREIVFDQELRTNLGQAGRLKAQEREASRLGIIWKNVLKKVILV
ncbi:MAG TPA: glycosyltransferase [Anaerolineaceae bacterium]